MSDLQQYVDSLRPDDEGDPRDGIYGFSREVPCLDFNREIVPPGVNPELPAGAIGVRVDDDFWIVGMLPYRFIGEDIRSIVRTLWPHLYDQAEFGPDRP